jgi:ABC-type lipoprotein export system ATPase subunit
VSNISNNPRGSVWHRWDPHIHTPETILNNQYDSSHPWDDYLTAIENASPAIKALGITDYYSLANYEKILDFKTQGRLKEVELIFANVEIRFIVGTARGAGINGHLLISPEDPHHLREATRFLQTLEFNDGRETYHCNREDLIQLGHRHDKSITHERKALEAGTGQFKVTLSQLLEEINKSEWAHKNILLGIAVGSNDGTSGLSSDQTFTATRKTIERSADLIFSGQENQRTFWLGEGVVPLSELIATYNNRKPCLHGSDAHQLADVGRPAHDRYTWIKGDVTFESLRQVCIEPKERVFIGVSPPLGGIDTKIFDVVEVQHAPWLTPGQVLLNEGLVAIIGARGSGKTALADIIAAGGNITLNELAENSFIKRAAEYLQQLTVVSTFKSREQLKQRIFDANNVDAFIDSRVQYLSQQFVEKLCSSEGLTDQLMSEIERVIFLSHEPASRVGYTDFSDMLDARASQQRSERRVEEDHLVKLTGDITRERLKRFALTALQVQKKDKQTSLELDKKSRVTLVSPYQAQHAQELQVISTALDRAGTKLESLKRKRQSLEMLQRSVTQATLRTFPEFLADLKRQHLDTGYDTLTWEQFSIGFKHDVESLLSRGIVAVKEEIGRVQGQLHTLSSQELAGPTLLSGSVAPEMHTYYELYNEQQRLQHLIGLDNENGKKYTRLTEKIMKDEAELVKIQGLIEDAEAAEGKIQALIEERKSSYQRLFTAIIGEQQELEKLYEPLKQSLQSQTGTLNKLSFHVQRTADIVQWAEEGEELLDLRKVGEFRGKGTLLNVATAELKKVWETGSAEQISEAMVAFRQKHEQTLLVHAQADRADKTAFSQWANKFASWLYSTRHITIKYGVQYEGVDIRQLSPGTRGIVLLLMYLAIDQEDLRPLIIDQPEENLDPKSIFDELVPLFREAKKRRQIIIVTHNANLVVNTDADQVIVAHRGAHVPGQLPDISYLSGGLENQLIRTEVCAILEGGEEAFRERAKRLRVNIK